MIILNASQAELITGMPKRLMEHCIKKYSMFPDVVAMPGAGKHRYYSERDVHIMKIAKRLLDMGYKLEKISAIVSV